MEVNGRGQSMFQEDSIFPLPGRVNNSMVLCKWWEGWLPLGKCLEGTFDPSIQQEAMEINATGKIMV